MSVQLYACTCGHLTIPRSFLLKGREGHVKVPVPAYLVVHPKGTALFDSGLHVDTQTDPVGHVGEFLARLHTFHFHPGEEVGARLGAMDVDPAGVRCVATYGHTPGHQSLRVRTENGEFVLCGDACYLKESLDNLHLAGVVADKDAALQAFQLFRDLQRAGARIMYGHDPDFWGTVPQAPLRLG